MQRKNPVAITSWKKDLKEQQQKGGKLSAEREYLKTPPVLLYKPSMANWRANMKIYQSVGWSPDVSAESR